MASAADSPVVLSLPFEGRWLTQNSPARRVPSHGTDLLGSRYAIDFVGVDDAAPDRGAGRLADRARDGAAGAVSSASAGRSCRPATGSSCGPTTARTTTRGGGLSWPSSPTRWARAPGSGLASPRSPATTSSSRCGTTRSWRWSICGAGRLRVAMGDEVLTGQVLAECGNSGNSTQPHVHVQVTDGPDMTTARARPMSFRPFREWVRGAREPVVRDEGVPEPSDRSSNPCRWCSRSGAMGWWDAMSEDAANPQDERTERAHYHVAEQQRRDARGVGQGAGLHRPVRRAGHRDRAADRGADRRSLVGTGPVPHGGRRVVPAARTTRSG